MARELSPLRGDFGGARVRTISSDTTLDDGDFIVFCDGTLTVDLPSSPPDDKVYILFRDGAAGTLTVDGNGNNVNGSSSKGFTRVYAAVILAFDGSEWRGSTGGTL